MRKIVFLLCFVFASTFVAFAKNDPDSLAMLIEQMKAFAKLKDSVNSAMHYETGAITLKGGFARLNVPKGFKYLGIEQSNYIIHDIWGNPKRDDILGMIFPDSGAPLADSSYAFIISFDDMGYVKDDDASKINYDDLLKEFQKEEISANAQRKAMGYSSIHFVGWAQTPFYDDKSRVLHWAKELHFGDEEGNTLNYDVRFLGRKGILSLNAVSGMSELPMVKRDINKILSMAEFTEGNRYEDFNDNTDKIAAYTVGGLIAGKVLLKTAAGVGILKFLKFIILGVVALGAGIWRWITGRKKKEEEFVYQPVPAPKPDEGSSEPQP